MKELRQQIESKLEEIAAVNHELDHGINYYLIDELTIDDSDYKIGYTCEWIHEDSGNDYPGYDSYKISIDFVVLKGKVNRVIYEKGGLFETIGETLKN